MQKLFLVCLLLLLFNQNINPQIPATNRLYPDSLLKLIKTKISDSLKASLYYQLSYYWSDIDTVKSKIFLANGFRHSAKNSFLKAQYYYYLGAYYYSINSDKSEKNYLKADQALAKFNTSEAFLFRAKAWANYANLQALKDNDLLMANLLLNKAIPFAKKAGNLEYLAKYYCDLGLAFSSQPYDRKAVSYFELAISTFEQTKLSEFTGLFDAYQLASKNYSSLGKIAEAKQKLDQAKKILPKCSTIENNISYYLAETIYFRHIKAYQKSLHSIEKGLQYANQTNYPYHLEKLNFQKYKIFEAQGDNQQAIDIIENILKQTQSKYLLNNLNYYKTLSILNKKLGKSKMAYKWLEKYTTLKDSLYQKDILHKMNALEVKFKTAENQKKIAELNTANQKANLSAKNSRLLNWLLGSISLLILSMFIFGIYYYHNQKKVNTQKDKIRISNAMIQGQETERYRVARDLHDGLGNVLVVVKFNLMQFAKEKPAPELDEVMYQLDHSIKELRQIAHDMMPEMLLSIGLEAALKDLCESLMSDELEVEYQFININSNISQPNLVAIYRIVQELLTNVVKHAEAKNVLLQCTQYENIFFIALEDDGKGFDPNQHKEKTGIGLGNIKSRVAYLDGKIEIGPCINQSGTSINIELNVKA